jgi:hypothetical protein
MSRAKLVLLSVVAVLAVGAMFVSSALAAVEFKWKVAGAELKTGESKNFTVSSDGKNFAFFSKLTAATALLLSHEVSVEGGKILGGVPGTNEETLVFKGVTSDQPENCTVVQSGVTGTVRTTPMKSELVEGAHAGVGNGEVDILVTPKTGETFTTFELGGSECSLKSTVFR